MAKIKEILLVVGQNTETSNTSTMIEKPEIITPVNGETDFIGIIESSEFRTSEYFYGQLQAADWEITTDSSFSTVDISSYNDTVNLTSFPLTDVKASTTYYVRVRYRSDNHISKWSDPVKFATPDAYIKIPSITIQGEPNSVPSAPIITGSEFTVVNGEDEHQYTDWVVKDSSGNTVWSSLQDTENLTSIRVPNNVLNPSTEYIFEVTYYGVNYVSSVGRKIATTIDRFSSVFDILGDGSIVAFYEFEGNANDTGGVYHGQKIGAITYVDGYISKAVKSNGNSQIKIYNLPFNKNTEVVTVSAWIKWNGNNSVMPFGWYKYDIYFRDGYFGFNTARSDIYGISSSGFKNTWKHLTVEFRKNRYGKLWVDGVRQNLSQVFRSINTSYAKMDSRFNIFGWGINYYYRNFGQVDNVRIFNRALTDAEVQYIYNAENQGG